MFTDRDGLFITFEGGDGAGKSTHIAFLAQTLQQHGYEVICTREPGNTVIGEKLRNIVLDPQNTEMADMCELLIYEAARAQLIHEVIRPNLKKGTVILCDRFSDSTVAYQAYGRGLDEDMINRLNAMVCDDVVPARTILMVSPGAACGLYRATKDTGADRLEGAGIDFHTSVNDGFMKLAEKNPQRIRTVYSANKKSETSKRVFKELADLFPWMEELLEDEEYFEPLNRKRKTVE